MLFSGKENVFMCLVAFQKNFRKIFFGVWKRRKRQTQKNTDKTQIDARRSTGFDAPRRFARSRSTAWSHEASIAISRSTAPIAIGAKARLRSTARSREASIAISRSTTSIAIGAKERSQWTARDRDLGSRSTARDRDRRHWCLRTARPGAQCVWTVRTSACFSLSRSRFLSLSLWNSFEVKIGTEIHFRSQSLFFGSTEINFRKILFSEPTKHPHFRKSISGNDFHPKQTQPKTFWWPTKRQEVNITQFSLN